MKIRVAGADIVTGILPSDRIDRVRPEIHFLRSQLCGFGAVNLAKAEITSVYVDPDFTRQGIASSLVGLMELAATDAGGEAGELAVEAGVTTPARTGNPQIKQSIAILLCNHEKVSPTTQRHHQ